MNINLTSTIDNKTEDFKKKISYFNDKSDSFVFICMMIGMKYLPYEINNEEIAKDVAENVVSDKKDAPINFILSSQNTDDSESDLVLGKCNYTDNCTQEQIKNDITKLVESYDRLKAISEGKCFNDFEGNTFERYQQVIEDLSDTPTVQFVLLYPKTLNENNQINISELEDYFYELIKKNNNDDQQVYWIEIEFSNTIRNEITNANNERKFVPVASVKMESDKILSYNDNAIIISLSAKSLKELYSKYKNELLEANLRYYIRNTKIDNKIKTTINENPNLFWYLNNGVTIVCSNFEVNPEELFVRLYRFSIVNGGQTTYLIYKNAKFDDNKDFYLVCKIIKVGSESLKERIDLTTKIAVAANSQKKIKEQDLVANLPEQIAFEKILKNDGVEYVIKQGSKKHVNEPYEAATMPMAGKLLMAGLLQLPGYARNKKDAIFDKSKNHDFYDYCFPYSPDENYEKDRLLKNHAMIVKQLLKVQYAYKKYLKTIKDSNNYKYAVNASTTVLSFITLLSRIANNNLDTSRLINEALKDVNSLSDSEISNNVMEWIPDSTKFEHIFNSENDMEELSEKLIPIFDYIVKNGNASYKENNFNNSDNEGNYLKPNNSYFKLLSYIDKNDGLKNIANKFFPF